MSLLDTLLSLRLAGNSSTKAQLEASAVYYASIESILRGTPAQVDIVHINTSYIVTNKNSLILADASDASLTLTLPSTTDFIDVTAGTSKILYIKKSDDSVNTITVQAAGDDTVEGDASFQLTSPLESVILVSDGLTWYKLSSAAGGGGGSGDVTGPASSTANALARFHLATGKIIKNSAVTLDDSGNLANIGNITLSGTVDGRDLSVDGAKLDGIEAGADVTDATNVDAAGALMTSDFPGGAPGFMHRDFAGTSYKVVRANLEATTDPTANEDEGDGYAYASIWVNTTNKSVWICTNPATGAAVWERTITTAEKTKLSNLGEAVWVTYASGASNSYANGVQYVPLVEAANDYIQFQFIPNYTGTAEINVLYAMSAANAGNVNLRVDYLNVASGADPSAALTTQSTFTVTPGNDTNVHVLNSSQSATLNISVTVNTMCIIKITRVDGGADTHTGDMRILDIRMKY